MKTAQFATPGGNAGVAGRWSKSFFFQTFIHGLILILPTIIILFLLSVIFKFVFNIVSPISSLLNQTPEENTLFVNILALLILLALIFLIGLVLRSTSRKQYFINFEVKYLLQIPLYSTIREIIAQFSGLKKMPFSQVVLVDAFNTGVLLTGFVTETNVGDMYTVFVPTGPNPMNGNIYHVPVSKLKFLEVEPEKAIRSVVGLGTGSACLFTGETSAPIPTNVKPDTQLTNSVENNPLNVPGSSI
jgi:uncharacterized membrane protein